MGVLIRRCLVIAAVLGGLAPPACELQAQGVSTPGLLAAFLLNFVKFTTWPDNALPARVPIVVCVSGNDRVADSLVQLTQNKTVEDHPLAIRRIDLNEPLNECHLVYGASLDANRAREFIRAASGRPILTVSDLEDFAARGGMANFFIDGGRMRFAVNPDAADRAGLRISSKLLTLARIMRNDRNP